MLQADDHALLRRAIAGEQVAFDALYRIHQPRIHSVIAHRADREAIEDLVQITFVRAFGALHSFRGNAALSTWLTQIALNVCKSHHRSRLARRTWLQEVEDPEAVSSVDREATLNEDPEKAMHRKERRELVRQGIKRLPSRYRKAMWLHYVMDWSYEEIAHALQVPMGTVKTWLFRARRRLKGEFRKLDLQPM